MADLSDVENQLKGLLASAIYPTGTANPSAILLGSTPVPVKIGRGWPLKDTLQKDLAAGVANVSIFCQPGAERNTTRFPKDWCELSPADATLEVTVTDTTVTLSGTVAMAIQAGPGGGSGMAAPGRVLGWYTAMTVVAAAENFVVIVDGKSYVLAVQAGMTLAQIAAAMAVLISVDTPATSSGPVITIPGAVDLNARSGGFGVMVRELRRQERLFQVTAWCPTPEQRDAVAKFVDGVIVGIGTPNGTEFIALPDGSRGRILYVRTNQMDRDELSGLFRRDLIYSVEYATTETRPIAQIVTTKANLTAGEGPLAGTDPAEQVLTFNQ